jgi:hypothetical protein
MKPADCGAVINADPHGDGNPEAKSSGDGAHCQAILLCDGALSLVVIRRDV